MEERPLAPLRAKGTFRTGWQERDFAALETTLATLGETAKPTAGEIAMLWHAALETLETASASGREEKKFKRALIRWLARFAPFMAASRRTFNRKLAEWRQGGRKAAALVDARPAANTRRRLVLTLPREDQERLLAGAIKAHGQEVAPAWREFMSRTPEQGGFLPATRERFGGDCPRSIRKITASRAGELYSFEHQPRKASRNAAYSNRDWSGVAAGDWFSSDDFTLEVYFYTPDGAGWWKLTRGQFLPMIDERSLCILDFILLPEKHYTGANVRTLMNKVGFRFGLPRAGFHFENGIWRESQLVAGAVPWGDVQISLQDRLGIEIQHSLPGNAKAKPVEFVGRLFQRRLRRFRGWAGRNEQVFKIEAVQAAKGDVEAGRKPPWEAGFHSLAEWHATLQSECVRYNRTPQRSRIMGGNRVVEMAPEQAWRALQPAAAALVNLKGSGAEHLLAMHWRELKVTRNGIRFRHDGVDYAYSDAQTGRLAGEPVKVYFDPEFPEIAHLETCRGEMVHVTGQRLMPAHGATEADYAHRAVTVEAHNAAMRGLVSQLPHDFMPPARVTVVDLATTRRQIEMASASQEIKAQQSENRRHARRMQTLTRKTGLHLAAPLDAPNAERGGELMAQALAEHDSE